MDTSIKYMWMCDCPEIQGKKSKDGHPEVGCWITRHLYISKTLDYWIMEKAPHVWLPRQDQIQEMLDWKSMGIDGPLYQLEAIDDWSGGEEIRLNKSPEDIAFDDKYDSLEKCWLAFYMWEKHKKIWDGKKWVA